MCEQSRNILGFSQAWSLEVHTLRNRSAAAFSENTDIDVDNFHIKMDEARQVIITVCLQCFHIHIGLKGSHVYIYEVSVSLHLFVFININIYTHTYIHTVIIVSSCL